MEIWFDSKMTNEKTLFMRDELLTEYIAQRIADQLQEIGWTDNAWVVEL